MEVHQGDIWWIDPTPKMGHEQRGRRPALVIQNDLANKYLQTTIVAIVSSSGNMNFPGIVPLPEQKELNENSHADFAQIFTIDKKRLTKKICSISPKKWKDVEEALATAFLKTLKT